MPIHVWGTDYHRSNPEFRKKLFLPKETRREGVASLLELGFSDIVYLHTCNRVEFYTTAKDHFTDTRPQWLKLFDHCGLPPDSFYKGYYLEGKSAVRHLVRVACALESLVLGEPQILGQLKEALAWTLEEKLPVSSPLMRAFQLAFFTAKDVRHQSGIGEKAVSVATLGIQRMQSLASTHPIETLAVVGRGPISRTVIRWVKKNHPKARIVWVNRDIAKLEEYAEASGVERVPLQTFLESPTRFSHLFTATSSAEPVFGFEFFGKLEGVRSLLFDFAQPPDICVECVPPQMELVPLESLKEEAEANRFLRFQATETAHPIIEKALQSFYLEQKETPLLRDFSQVEPLVLESLDEQLQTIESLVPDDSLPRFKKWAQSLVKKNLHLSREHLRGILRQAASQKGQDPPL